VIASALALEPTTLVADEPVASLDASVRGEILALILRLREEIGLSALVISHDLGLAWNIADRVAVMYLGRIVEQGRVEDVLLQPRHPYTRALLAATPDPDRRGAPPAIGGEPPDPTAIPAGCRFHPRCARRRELAERGVDVESCRTTDVALQPIERVEVACRFADADTAESAAGRLTPREPTSSR
jgi:peptide/nickel transport system ATP-binding protein